MKRDVRLYLDDILEAIVKIEEYVAGFTLSRFEEDRKTVDSVIRNFEVIGEASKNIPEEIRGKYPIVPWKEMAGMRDKLIHEYFGINIEVVWETIVKRLPELKISIEKVIKEQ